MSIIIILIMEQQTLCKKLETNNPDWSCEMLLDHLAKELAQEYVQLMAQAVKNSTENNDEVNE